MDTRAQHVAPILHYLDNFLTMGPPQLPTFTNNLTVIKDICSLLGIPLALEKIEGPSQNLTFLGITLDTDSMQARLPEDKLRRIQNQVATWLPRKKATK